MPDVAQVQRDFTRIEAIDLMLGKVAAGIARAKAEGDHATVRDGYVLASSWLDKRLKDMA